MPWEALVSRFAASITMIIAVSVIYFRMLLWSRRYFKGTVKATIDLLAYMLMGVVIAGSFVYILLAAEDPSMRQGLGYLVTVMFLWAASVVPTYLYILCYKMPRLPAVGVVSAQD